MSYSKNVLNDSGKTIGWLHPEPIYRVRGSEQRVYLVRSQVDLKGLPRKAATAYHCPCGSLFAWMGDPRNQPDCPSCKERKEGGKLYILKNYKDIADMEAAYRAKNAYGYQNGVYVDVALRNGKLVLGFAAVRDEQAKFFSCGSVYDTNTAAAETEACRLAKKMWPDLPVNCDHLASCVETGAFYIKREKNKLAHKVARSRINFGVPSC